MKVVAFNGSGRKDGNTAILVNYVFEELKKEGIETELVQLAGKKIRGCAACYKCFKNKDQQCSVKDDVANECIEKMIEAQGIILASPTYFADVTAGLKALIERSGYVSKANDDLLKSIHAFDSINHFFLISQMIVPGSRYWNMAIGLDPGEVEGDKEGLQIMKTLGQNMAWLLKKTHG